MSFPQPFANRGTCALCSLGGEGSGILIPLLLLPRPRIAMLWLGTGLTSAANLLTSKGYVAEGAQTGFAFGFMGIGLSYALPGHTLYGFIGYALLASTTAEYVEHYPPNRAPTISDVLPADGEQNIPLSLSELQFQIQDADGDLMSSPRSPPNLTSDLGVKIQTLRSVHGSCVRAGGSDKVYLAYSGDRWKRYHRRNHDVYHRSNSTNHIKSITRRW